MKLVLLFCLLAITLNGQDTIVVNFESFGLGPDSFLNGEDGSQGFVENEVYFPNVYEDAFGSWSGWAISSFTDTTTPGFSNQYSAIAGSGAEGSTSFATTFVLSETLVEIDNYKKNPLGFYVTNNTYTYLSMLEGDSFAKKFGGESGDDPDFFLLTIKGYVNGEMINDSIDFYLADYRSTDNSEDYIIDDWTWVDLEDFGLVDSLAFSLSSSDNGAFGMNTPAYFCMDQFTLLDLILADASIEEVVPFLAYPNPVGTKLNLELGVDQSTVRIFNVFGQLMYRSMNSNKNIVVDVSKWPIGTYFIENAIENQGKYVEKLIVNR